jgi:hypothetical protein
MASPPAFAPRGYVSRMSSTAKRKLQSRALALTLVAVLAVAVASLLGGSSRPSTRVCVSAQSRSAIAAFGKLVGRPIDCALVFNDAAPDWAGWVRPWFTNHPYDDLNFGRWATAPGHELIITQNLFPSTVAATDWRDAGARGDYARYARELARNLVAAGLGNSVIRLGHEANGTWYPDSIGTTPRDFARWREFWRKTVVAMRSVPGAHFRFDWCVNAAVRNIPLNDYYPGDDVVDIVGVDAYDVGVHSLRDRWPAIYKRPGGVRDVLEFAKAHRKPLSIPEWGVGPASDRAYLPGGDDPGYVNGIAAVVRGNDVAYQSYFFKHEWADQLLRSPASLAAYRRHFGARGDSAP